MLIFLFITWVGCENLARSMLNLINTYRSDDSRKSLASIQNLENAARDQALYMCENSILTHNNPEGNLRQRAKKNMFKGSSIGENIAKSHNDNYESVANTWLKSPRHKKNIMGEFNYTGIATCLDKKGSRFWVQVFGQDTGSSDHDTDSGISLDEKGEPNQFNSTDNLINGNSPDKKFHRSINSMPIYGTDLFCPQMGGCFFPAPAYNTAMPKITRISIRTTFIPISTTVFKSTALPVITTIFRSVPEPTTILKSVIEPTTIFKSMTQQASTLTVIKTISMEPQTTTLTSTIVVVPPTVSTASTTTHHVVTVTRTISEIKTVKSIKEPPVQTTERTVTVVRTITVPASTGQPERVIMATVERSRPQPEEPVRSTQSTEENSNQKAPRLIRLIPDKEYDLKPQTNKQGARNSQNGSSNNEKRKGRNPSIDSDKNIESELRRLLSGMKNGNKEESESNNDDMSQGHSNNGQGHSNNSQGHSNNSQGHSNNGQGHSNNGQGHSNNGQGYLNENGCGDQGNPCIRAFIIR